MAHYALIPDRLWDGTCDSVATGLAVVVNGPVIEAVTAVEALPAGLSRRMLPGCTLLPGLIDAHVHYSSVMGPAFLAAGVTTIRDVGNELEWILRQRAEHAEDLSRGPTILCCGHLHDGPKAHWPHMGKPNADAAAMESSIRHHVECGVDQIKLYAFMDLEMLTAGVRQAHQLGKFVVAHLGGVKIEQAAAAGLDEFEHLAGCDVAWGPATEEQDDAVIDLLLKHNVVIDPTLVVWDRIGRMLDRSFHHDERRRWVHPCHRDIWNQDPKRFQGPEARLGLQAAIPHLKRFLRRAHGRGVTIALGTDTPFPHLVPGFSVHDELAMYVDAGLKPIDALRSATSINARVLGIEGRTGRIAPGMAADLAAFRGNPIDRIDDISDVSCTVRGGRLFESRELIAAVEATFAVAPDDPITRDLLCYVNGKRS